MIDVLIDGECVLKLKHELLAAGANEIGGVLAAQQIGDGRFLVVDVSVQRNGTQSRFERDPAQHRAFIRRFHLRMDHRPEIFNYLGEWHSHPTHTALPSDVDLRQMQDLVEDDEQMSTFLALMIVKLDEQGELRGSVHGFRPGLPPVRGRLQGIENEVVQDDPLPIILILRRGEGHHGIDR